MNATDIVAYTYQAETLCPRCVVAKTVKTKTLRDYILNEGAVEVERWLDSLATMNGVNRQDEYSFDSADFPKVVFCSQIEDGETCHGCGDELP